MKKQSKQSKISIKRFLCVSILIIVIITFSSMSLNATTDSYNPPSYSSLTPHDPISITSDSDFEVFPGAGTEEDPYLIRNFNITTNESIGVCVYYTTKYFVIENCYINARDRAIAIGLISESTAKVLNNTCENGERGIFIEETSSHEISSNVLLNCQEAGIFLENCGNYRIEENIFTNCGLYLDGYSIDEYRSIYMKNNIVNSRLLGLFIDTIDSTILSNEYGQLFLINCDNVTIKNVSITDTSVGIFLAYCDNCNIIGNTLTRNNWGIHLESSLYIKMIDNDVSKSVIFGIYAVRSQSLAIVNNSCSYCYRSICIISSHGTIIENNTCNENINIGLYSASSNNLVIHNNRCIQNSRGIDLWLCHYPEISYNDFSYNMKEGLLLVNCFYSMISKNNGS